MKRRIRQLSIIALKFLLLYLPYSTLQAETVVLASVDFPPYEFATPQNGVRGFDVEVIEAAFKRVNISTKFKFLPWKRGLEQTKGGFFTGIFSCGHRVEREKFIIYSAPISRQTDVYFIRRDFDGFEPSDLKTAQGLKVATILGWNQVRAMEEVGATVIEYRTVELLFRDLLKGLIDYSYLPLEGPIYKAMNLGISKDIRFIKVKKSDLYVCFSKKWPNIEEIVQKFNAGLAAVRKDGSYDRIHARYR